MRVKKDTQLRSVGDIYVKKEGQLRAAYVIKAKVAGRLYIVWQKVKELFGFIKTNNGKYLKSQSGKFIKCNNQ